MPKKPELLTNQQFGRLRVLQKSNKKSNSGETYYFCECICANITEVLRYQLISGNTKSCGCLRRDQNKKPPGESSFKAKFHTYKKSAEKRNISFYLSYAEFKHIISKKCHHCGKLPEAWSFNKTQRDTIFVNGVDRLDNKKGYLLENSVPCCQECNESKSARTVHDFIDHCKRVAAHNEGKV